MDKRGWKVISAGSVLALVAIAISLIREGRLILSITSEKTLGTNTFIGYKLMNTSRRAMIFDIQDYGPELSVRVRRGETAQSVNMPHMSSIQAILYPSGTATGYFTIPADSFQWRVGIRAISASTATVPSRGRNLRGSNFVVVVQRKILETEDRAAKWFWSSFISGTSENTTAVLNPVPDDSRY